MDTIYNVIIDYDIIPNKMILSSMLNYDKILSYEYIKKETKNNVRDFTCNKCKKKIINVLDLKQNISNNHIFITKNNEKCISLTLESQCQRYFKQRRKKHILLIMANLFDSNSIFSFLPIDVIYHIIFSIYWDPINAIIDNSLYIKDFGEILYSYYRPIFGINSK